jgi:hypothetical protein
MSLISPGEMRVFSSDRTAFTAASGSSSMSGDMASTMLAMTSGLSRKAEGVRDGSQPS